MRAYTALLLSAIIAVLVSACAAKPARSTDPHTSDSKQPAAAVPDGNDAPAAAAPHSSAPHSSAPTPVSASLPDPIPTPGQSPAAAPGPGTSAPVAQTSEERRAAIDKRLDDSLGAFDAELKKEQQQVAQERDARQGATTAGADASGNSDPTHQQSGSAGTEVPKSEAKGDRHHRGQHDEDDKRDGRAGDLKSDKAGSANSGGASGNGSEAREIPDGSDDDVVARRLRKAAEQETDPELKEKLWHEYVEYKKNAQGK